MNDYTRKLLDKAIDAIESAELLLDHGKTDVAAGRAYYTLFYTQGGHKLRFFRNRDA